MTAASQHELETELRITLDKTARVILRGCLDAQTVAGCWNDLQHLRLAAISTLEVDATGLRFCDSAGLALLHYARSIALKSATPGALMEGWNQALTQVLTQVISDFRHSESEERRERAQLYPRKIP